MAAQVTIGAGELKLGGTILFNNANTNPGLISGVGGGKLSLMGNRTINVYDVSAAEDLVISAIIQDGDAGHYNITKSQLGTLVFTAANTYSGTTSLNGGAILLENENAIQNSKVVGGITPTFDSSVATHTFTFGGWGGNSSIVLEDNAGNPVTLRLGNNNADSGGAAVISGAGNLVKIGEGKLTLNASETYTGTTTVEAGELAVAGSLQSSLVSVKGGILSGTGTMGAVEVRAGGTIAPGGVGILHTGNTTFFSGATYAVDITGSTAIAGTDYDQLDITGTADLGASTLAVNLSNYTAVDGQLFFIINNDGSDAAVNLFNGLSQNSEHSVLEVGGWQQSSH